jgi:hypothetical protein
VTNPADRRAFVTLFVLSPNNVTMTAAYTRFVTFGGLVEGVRGLVEAFGGLVPFAWCPGGG